MQNMVVAFPIYFNGSICLRTLGGYRAQSPRIPNATGVPSNGDYNGSIDPEPRTLRLTFEGEPA